MYLFLSEPRLKGQVVKRVQEMLLVCGYDVGEYGPDGVFGVDTMKAVIRFQTNLCLSPDGVVGSKTWARLEQEATRKVDVRRRSYYQGAGVIIDISNDHKKPKLYRQKRSPRPWSQITGVTLHQTGCNLSDTPQRWYPLNAHIGVLKDGTILLVNDLTDFIWHAQGFSHETIGIEFNGNFWGVGSDISTWWPAGGEASFLTRSQKFASDFLLKYLVNQFNENGATLKHIYAHRQASNTRRSDPGSEIWKEIALPWMEETGATDGGPDFVYGFGRPIPKQWNPDYKHNY